MAVEVEVVAVATAADSCRMSSTEEKSSAADFRPKKSGCQLE